MRIKLLILYIIGIIICLSLPALAAYLDDLIAIHKWLIKYELLNLALSLYLFGVACVGICGFAGLSVLVTYEIKLMVYKIKP